MPPVLPHADLALPPPKFEIHEIDPEKDSFGRNKEEPDVDEASLQGSGYTSGWNVQCACEYHCSNIPVNKSHEIYEARIRFVMVTKRSLDGSCDKLTIPVLFHPPPSLEKVEGLQIGNFATTEYENISDKSLGIVHAFGESSHLKIHTIKSGPGLLDSIDAENRIQGVERSSNLSEEKDLAESASEPSMSSESGTTVVEHSADPNDRKRVSHNTTIKKQDQLLSDNSQVRGDFERIGKLLRRSGEDTQEDGQIQKLRQESSKKFESSATSDPSHTLSAKDLTFSLISVIGALCFGIGMWVAFESDLYRSEYSGMSLGSVSDGSSLTFSSLGPSVNRLRLGPALLPQAAKEDILVQQELTGAKAGENEFTLERSSHEGDSSAGALQDGTKYYVERNQGVLDFVDRALGWRGAQ